MVKIRLSVTLLPLLVLLAGCGEAGEPDQPSVEQRSVSATLECENNLRHSGTPDYGIGQDTVANTEAPLDQAQRYVDATHLRRDYPDVTVVVARTQPTSQVVALVSDAKTVGILRYETDEQLGWHATYLEGCSPSR